MPAAELRGLCRRARRAGGEADVLALTLHALDEILSPGAYSHDGSADHARENRANVGLATSAARHRLHGPRGEHLRLPRRDIQIPDDALPGAGDRLGALLLSDGAHAGHP